MGAVRRLWLMGCVWACLLAAVPAAFAGTLVHLKGAPAAEFASESSRGLAYTGSMASSPFQRGEVLTADVRDQLYQDFLDRAGLTHWQLMLLIVVLPAGLLMLAVARELRPFGLASGDARLLRAGWGRYQLHEVSGTVDGVSKERVVTTHVSGGGTYTVGNTVHSHPITTSTSTTIYDRFFIRTRSGHQEPISLVNVDISVCGGQSMSALWAIRKGRKSGAYFLFHNRSTNRLHYMSRELKRLLAPHKWPVLPLLVFTAAVWGMWAWYAISQGRQVGPDMPLSSLGCTLLAEFIGFFVWRAVVYQLRARAFKRRIESDLLPSLR